MNLQIALELQFACVDMCRDMCHRPENRNRGNDNRNRLPPYILPQHSIPNLQGSADTVGAGGFGLQGMIGAGHDGLWS